MSKVRTKSGWAKRVKIRKSGKISRRRAGKRHMLISKSQKRKRRLRRPAQVSRADMRRIRGY
jgi:large subunit ribosomal protein L35